MASLKVNAANHSAAHEKSAAYRIPIGGFADRLEISPSRTEILVAAVKPNGTVKSNEEYGIYTFSLSNPRKPKRLGFFPILNPEDLALSPDGKTAYVISFRGGGYPEDSKYYGLFVLDISKPESPTLLSHIVGSFFAVGLSRSGNILFLQENHFLSDNRPTGADITRAYALSERVPDKYCSVEFYKPEVAFSIFAYSYITFSDSDLIGINDRGRSLRFFDITNACNPDGVIDIPNRDGSYVVGWKQGRLIGGDEGLSSYRYASPDERWKGYKSRYGFLSHIRIFEQYKKLAALELNTVLVFRLADDGKFFPLGKYRLHGSGDAVIGEGSMLYIGGTGWLRAIKMRELGSNRPLGTKAQGLSAPVN